MNVITETSVCTNYVFIGWIDQEPFQHIAVSIFVCLIVSFLRHANTHLGEERYLKYVEK